jgi:trk system potassium uptake protein TrkH
MRYHIVLRYAGIILLINAAFLLISGIISFWHGDSGFFPLIYTAIIAALFGVFPFIFVPSTEEISIKEGFTIVVSSWILSCLIGMVPYILWGGEFTFTNAWFESVSGFTTTGSSILTNIEALPDGLLFWRSTTQWIGGVGIIIFALSILPSMGKIGMTLYRSEISPLAAANFRYQTRETLRIIMTVYVGLTIAETILLMFCGMDLFDAITHSFATIATGGFSPKNLSVAHYGSIQIETVIIIFMILSGINFGLLFLTFSGKARMLLKSTILRTYLIMLFAGVALVAINIHGTVYGEWGGTIRHAAFQVISIGTSTGFASADSTIWPPFSQMLIIFFTLLCACSGSTSGGIKVDRIVLFWHAIKKRITEIQHTHAIVKAKIEGLTIDDDVLEASLLYIILYVGIVFISGLIISFLGVDIMTAFSASAATMGNVGPGFGLVGSASNFANIPELGKWILTGDMLLGRLEIFGLLLFFLLKFWK